MEDKILKGKDVAMLIRKKIKADYDSLKLDIAPCICIIQIGNNPASNIYAQRKQKLCVQMGFKSKFIELSGNSKEDDIVNIIEEYNKKKDIHGIFLEMPIPDSIKMERLINAISPEKDIDCQTTYNIGNLFSNPNNSIAPCTALAVIAILTYYKIGLNGKNVVIVGRSNVVGKPLIPLLLARNATVTICHSYTKSLEKITNMADILIVAIGRKNYINSDHVATNCIIIDVGINVIDDLIFGDVDSESIKDKVFAYTPVPGGVGAVTTSVMLFNLYNAFRNQNGLSKIEFNEIFL